MKKFFDKNAKKAFEDYKQEIAQELNISFQTMDNKLDSKNSSEAYTHLGRS